MKSEAAYDVTWLIRRVFRGLAELADQYLKDSDLTATDRAVLEFLFPDSRLSVPAMAGKYQVSRQHIQTTVNRLIVKGLIRSESNPNHKRSPLMRLSHLGRETFAEIRRNETELLERLFSGIGAEDLHVTRRSLRSLLENLN